MNRFCRVGLLAIGIFWLSSLWGHTTGNVIFIHPDGTGLGHWNAARHYLVGPDGMLNWDKMNRLAAYRVHQKNWLSTTSHAGATAHAYGRKVHYESYGLDQVDPLISQSGIKMTIMEEAMAAGKRVGVINSGHLGEPGTGVFLARSAERNRIPEIAAQIINSGADLIFCGGEIYLLPEGVMGKHGRKGVRKDGRDLIMEAKAAGYQVIMTREELISLKPGPGKVLGIFAATNTYNDRTLKELRTRGLPTYNEDEPTMAEMMKAALGFLSSDPKRNFLLVAEEEGTDNFSNKLNTIGMLDAIARADEAIGVAMDFQKHHPQYPTLLLVGADSDAGHPSVWSPKNWKPDYQLPMTSGSGAQIHGPNGQGGDPFWSKPDAFGNRYPFGIAWAGSGDLPGSAVTKAEGHNSDLLKSSVDNTGLYTIMYEVLFGENPGNQ